MDIVKPNIFKRVIVALLDLVVFVVICIASFEFIGSPILRHTTNYDELVDKYDEMRLDSHLYVRDSNGYVVAITSDYEENLEYFYDKYDLSIDDLNNEKEESELFEIVDGKYQPVSDATEEELTSFYNTIAVAHARLLFSRLDEVSEVIGKINSYFYTTFTIVFLVTSTVYYLIVPLCFKNGETLFKKVFKLGLTNKEGYQINKVQVLTRYLVIGPFELFLSLPLIGLPLLISLFTLLFTKSNRALHDFVAQTMVVDTGAMTIYKNFDEFKEKNPDYNKENYDLFKEEKDNVDKPNDVIDASVVKEESDSSEDSSK